MGDKGGAIAGEGKGGGIDKPGLYGGEDGDEGKDRLERGIRVIGSGAAIQDVPDDVISSNGGRILGLNELAIRADDLIGLFAIYTGREEEGTGIAIPWTQPETVHKVIVRAKGRQVIRGSAANEEGQGNRVRKDLSDPRGKAGPGIGAVEERSKKDEGTQDLSLM